MAEVKLTALPKKVRDIYEKGNAALERGKLDFAIDMFLHAANKEPGLLRARELVRRIEIKKAKEKKGIAGLTSISGMKTVMGVKKQKKKDPLAALPMAEDLLRLDIKNPQFIDLYVEVAEEAGFPEAAAQTLELVIPEFFAEDKKILIKLGELYQRMGDTGMEVDAYQRLVELDRTDQNSLKRMKDASARHSMNKSGIEKYHADGDQADFRETQRDRKEAEELERQNRAVKSEDDISRGVERLIAAIEAEPDKMNHYRDLADLYEQAEEFDEARDVLETAYERGGQSDPEIERAISGMNIKIYEANIEHYESEGDEENAQEMREALFAYRLDDAETAVAKYPNDTQLKFTLGELLYQQGDIQRAIPLFQKSRTHPKCRQESLFYLAMCFKAKGTLDLATDILTEAIDEIEVMSHTKKDMYYELGLIKEAMGDLDGAKACFKAIYQVDYEYKDVAARIEGG